MAILLKWGGIAWGRVCLFCIKHPVLEAFLVQKQLQPTYLCNKKVNFCQPNIHHISLAKYVWLSTSEWFFKKKYCAQWVHICWRTWTTYVQNKYLKELFGKSGAYKFKYTLKRLLSQNMVHFTWNAKSGSMDLTH